MHMPIIRCNPSDTTVDYTSLKGTCSFYGHGDYVRYPDKYTNIVGVYITIGDKTLSEFCPECVEFYNLQLIIGST